MIASANLRMHLDRLQHETACLAEHGSNAVTRDCYVLTCLHGREHLSPRLSGTPLRLHCRSRTSVASRYNDRRSTFENLPGPSSLQPPYLGFIIHHGCEESLGHTANTLLIPPRSHYTSSQPFDPQIGLPIDRSRYSIPTRCITTSPGARVKAQQPACHTANRTTPTSQWPAKRLSCLAIRRYLDQAPRLRTNILRCLRLPQCRSHSLQKHGRSLRHQTPQQRLDRRQPRLCLQPACVCNLDHDAWAPDNWRIENCAFTPLQHPDSLTRATPIPSTAAPPDTYALLNSGFFLYHPSPEL